MMYRVIASFIIFGLMVFLFKLLGYLVKDIVTPILHDILLGGGLLMIVGLLYQLVKYVIEE